MRFMVVTLLVCGSVVGTAGSASADFYSAYQDLSLTTGSGGTPLSTTPGITLTVDNSFGHVNPYQNPAIPPYYSSSSPTSTTVTSSFISTSDFFIAVTNLSGLTITSICMSGVMDDGSNIFTFDGMGIQNFGMPSTGSGGKGTGAEFEGPGTAFSFNPNLEQGTIRFIQGAGLPNGETA